MINLNPETTAVFEDSFKDKYGESTENAHAFLAEFSFYFDTIVLFHANVEDMIGLELALNISSSSALSEFNTIFFDGFKFGFDMNFDIIAEAVSNAYGIQLSCNSMGIPIHFRTQYFPHNSFEPKAIKFHNYNWDKVALPVILIEYLNALKKRFNCHYSVYGFDPDNSCREFVHHSFLPDRFHVSSFDWSEYAEGYEDEETGNYVEPEPYEVYTAVCAHYMENFESFYHQQFDHQDESSLPPMQPVNTHVQALNL